MPRLDINFAEYVLSGYYNGEQLSSQDINVMTEYIAQEVVLNIRNEWEFYSEWKSVSKSLDDGMYLSMLYYLVSTLLDFFNFESANDDQKRSVRLFSKKLLQLIALHEKASPLDGGVEYWTRLGDVERDLGNKESAIEVYNEGINALKRASNWQPGQLIGREEMFGAVYSMIEALYAKRGRCEYELGRFAQAVQTLELVLNSIGMRGHNDMINQPFPQGLRPILAEARRKNRV